jgi:FixJ family two-component response regulator
MATHRPLLAVVDDDESVRQALARMLRASQYDVISYATGEAFMASLIDGLPDCVILDFHLPGMSGRDVQRALAKDGKHVPVIVVTAHDQPTLREQCIADGAVAYLNKPLQRADLVATIGAALQRSHR